MHKIDIKPLSVNEAWIGRLRPSAKWTTYKEGVPYLLPKLDKDLDLSGKLKLTIVFGFSSKASDIDNPLKPFIDCLQEKYSFNDNQIYELVVFKESTKKGQEFIKFKLSAL